MKRSLLKIAFYVATATCSLFGAEQVDREHIRARYVQLCIVPYDKLDGEAFLVLLNEKAALEKRHPFLLTDKQTPSAPRKQCRTIPYIFRGNGYIAPNGKDDQF